MDPRCKTALVSGGTSGLGLAAARLLLAKQANVAVLGVGPVAEAAASLGPGVLGLEADITDQAAVAGAVDTVVERFGALHISVNTAGVMTPVNLLGENDRPNDLAELRRMIEVNLVGTYAVIGQCAAAMLRNPVEDGERGVIVNTASIAALDGTPGQGPYAATKAGLIALALPLARELAGRGIRINTVTPGGFDTPMNAWIPQDYIDSVSAQVPNPRRLGKAAEYAAMALAMIENTYANATSIRLDGGYRMS
jgi:NAD(P)-dependent dehydrogenase (short-subunit alcohol dehydrogenase family)